MRKEPGKRFSQEEIEEIRAKEKALRTEVEKQGYTILWTHYFREDEKVLAFTICMNGTVETFKARHYAATSCILLVGDEVISRGFVVCSYEDQALKAYGRWLSLKRALYAAENECETKRISSKGCMNVGTDVQTASRCPALTPLEAQRVAKIKPCEACHA